MKPDMNSKVSKGLISRAQQTIKWRDWVNWSESFQITKYCKWSWQPDEMLIWRKEERRNNNTVTSRSSQENENILIIFKSCSNCEKFDQLGKYFLTSHPASVRNEKLKAEGDSDLEIIAFKVNENNPSVASFHSRHGFTKLETLYFLCSSQAWSIINCWAVNTISHALNMSSYCVAFE